MDAACGAISDGVVQLSYLECIFGRVVSIFLGLAGIVLFVLLLAGGFKYITAGGDPKGVEGAKKTLSSAILGMVLLAASFLILRFIATLVGIDSITQFTIFQGN